MFLVIASGSIYAQKSYYVEKTNKRFEQPIADKLVALNKKIATSKETSNYTIQCIIEDHSSFKSSAKGYIAILDTKTGNVISKSELAKGVCNLFNGYTNSRKMVMKKIAKRYLGDILMLVEKY